MLLEENKSPLMFNRPRIADKRILEGALGLYQGLHVGANLPQFMTDFVRNLGMPFIVDPMVYIFTLRPKQLLDRKKGTLRPSINNMGNQYGSLCQQSAGKKAITPTDFLSDSKGLESITASVLRYQKSKFSGQLQIFNSYYDKYAFLDDGNPHPTGVASSPEVLVPPYFPFKKPGDQWYSITLECAKLVLSLKEQNDRIFPVILLDSGILKNSGEVNQIIDEFGSQRFDGFFPWINDFKEENEKLEKLKGLLRLVKGLASDNRLVFKLFGGYFSALLFAYGLKGFSCGLGYGSDKNVFKFDAGGGKTVPKFYIPKLHHSLELGDAERLLRAYPSLQCHCKVCRGVYANNMDDFTEMRQRGRCESHFLNIRRNELKEIGEKGFGRVFSEMENAIKEFDRELLVNVESLKLWCKALEGSTR